MRTSRLLPFHHQPDSLSRRPIKQKQVDRDRSYQCNNGKWVILINVKLLNYKLDANSLSRQVLQERIKGLLLWWESGMPGFLVTVWKWQISLPQMPSQRRVMVALEAWGELFGPVIFNEQCQKWNKTLKYCHISQSNLSFACSAYRWLEGCSTVVMGSICCALEKSLNWVKA